MKRSRKILAVTAAVLAALLTLAVLLAPRIVNTEAVRQTVERAVSRELGGTLAYDRVTLAVLPRPRIMLQHPSIGLPGGISASLRSLDLYPALLPLLGGNFRISSVHLVRPDVLIALPPKPVTVSPKISTLPAAGSERIKTAAAKMADISLAVEEGSITVMQGKEPVLTVRDLRSRMNFLPRDPGTSDAAGEEAGTFHVAGDLSCTIDVPAMATGNADLSIDRFDALPRTLTVSRARARILDLSISLSGTLDDYLTGMRKADLTVKGTAGRTALMRFRDLTTLPALRAPVALSDTRIQWTAGGTVSAAGSAVVKNGPVIAFDVRRSAGTIAVKRITINDNASRASFSGEKTGPEANLVFSGALAGRTLEDLFEIAPFNFGTISGDLTVHFSADRPLDLTAEGALEGDAVAVPWKKQVPLMIDHFSLSAQGRSLSFDTAAITLGKSKGSLAGTIAAHDEGLDLDLGVTSRDVAWSDLQGLVASGKEAAGEEDSPEKKERGKGTVRGVIRVDIDLLRAKRFAFQPVHGEIVFEKDRTRYEVREAKACGIGLSGVYAVSRQESDLSLRMSANQLDLDPTLACLSGSDLRITGNFDLAGTLAGRGSKEKLFRSLTGKVAFAARNGRVYNDYLVVPILKYKRIADLLRDSTGDARKNGIPYDTFGVRGTVNNGIFSMTEGVVKSPVMNLAARGEIDLSNEKLDLTVLIAPYTTVDAVVRHIPLLGRILGGTLVTVPLGVQGPFKDVKVTPLPPSAIGEGLLGIMRRTLTLPFTVIDDLLPRKNSGNPPLPEP